MGNKSGEDTRALLVLARDTLRVSQKELGERLGVSSKTITRWIARGAMMAPATVGALAKAVHARDPALARRIAAAHGHSLEALGVESRAALATGSAARSGDAKDVRNLADAIVCAAAEVADVSPRVMRPALAAALDRAREAGLSIDETHALLATSSPAPKKR